MEKKHYVAYLRRHCCLKLVVLLLRMRKPYIAPKALNGWHVLLNANY
jgi:hypothetical protein